MCARAYDFFNRSTSLTMILCFVIDACLCGDRAVQKSKLGMSKEELLEMKRIMRERAEAAAKKDLGLKVDDKAGVRTQSMMRGLVAPGTKTV